MTAESFASYNVSKNYTQSVQVQISSHVGLFVILELQKLTAGHIIIGP